MRTSVIKSYEELPLFLSVAAVADLLGISPSSCYELMRTKDFPMIRIGNRIVVPRENLKVWVDAHIKTSIVL